MRDASTNLFRTGTSGRTALRAAIAAALLALACGLGGCASGGAGSGSFAMAGSGPTVAFESIDGPPPQVFERMVSVLDSESKLRNLQIVSREGSAAYRVRSYLAAQVSRGRTTIAWVWDVYDRDQQRALRLSGEEPAGKAGRDAWAAADDLILRKIAQAGLSGLSAMINGTAPAEAPPPAPAPAPGRRGPAVASAELPSLVSDGFTVGALGSDSAPGGESALGYSAR
ncbi:hypothetical protein KMZ93_22165 [Bradyrhizobium sediminis]|uniref:Uncharacterized protein n=1 Tax=Bradyrhizobium sediminis TaxID=2840469 RepID=A0A975RWT6_9BRAD|nr:hypothetical protein [Bradyrhizobium sediminis]QWG22634.1 hypothetical protein KMZ93_22165 [Bradyrhizobium sediminis]